MSGPESDTIAVRADESFETAPLHEFLRERLPGGEAPLRIRQFGGGHANLTYLLQYLDDSGGVGREWVLRRPPLGPVAPGAHDMEREYRALAALWRAFDKAPRAHVYCGDASVIGAPFFVMERLEGIVVRGGGVPEVFGGGDDEVANRKLSEVVIDTLVEFHAVDPEPIGLEGLGRDPAGFLQRQVEGWANRYERSKVEPRPKAEEAMRWLLAERPGSPAPSLLHNDWKLDNMAVDASDPGRCVAVYDWDMCTIGDPLCDLGTLLALWSNAGQPRSGTNPMPTQAKGFMSREEAVQRYGEKSGRDVSGAAYYDVFGTFKMGVVLQQIWIRYHRGQTRDPRFASLGEAADSLYELALARRP